MDREFLIDLFAGFGPVTIRRMFSGFGISADGINFALALRSGLYLRADEASFAKFEAAGSKPFSYETRARTMTVRSYWQVPAHLFDDTDEFAGWAREALAAAQRAALTKRTKKKRATSSRSGREPSAARGGAQPETAGKATKTAKSVKKARKTAKSTAKAAAPPPTPKRSRKALQPRKRSGASSARR
ncbi:TfoX/Sxy family protein [Bradyrhizobium ontarionense]|uniref:TfoX/Sxy family protein n=1 Tax=Bradyrhizobium ontarionense TaxID=2898149 RepID=A0ABY3RE24_9BRAD|nr:TfoX/Sxy family protein [Bradyrhizobium sp. A19]UFZ05526.1 TfoX/Sxy family protein [Bradyrhizobium sp. A19]